MHVFRSAFLALATTAALALPPLAHADEYTKRTYLTFSAPVQVPGVTLPAGTYMFRLANPESGRRAIQIWNEDGSQLFTTLLTITDEQQEAQSEPVVLFDETPAGAPAAIRSWFYPGDRMGMEFIYPKDQATRIARDANTSVLTFADDAEHRDEAAMRASGVGRIDAQGRMTQDDQSDDRVAANPTAPANPDASHDPAATAVGSDSSSPSANRTQSGTASAATSSSDTDDQTTSSTPPNAAATSNRSAAADANAAPSANRTGTGSSVGGAVGTSGSVEQSGAQGTSTAPRELPQTASRGTWLAVFSILSLGTAAGVRRLRLQTVRAR